MDRRRAKPDRCGMEVSREKQNDEKLQIESKLAPLTTEMVLYGTVRDKSCSITFVDQVVKMYPEYACFAMSVLQRCGSGSS